MPMVDDTDGLWRLVQRVPFPQDRQSMAESLSASLANRSITTDGANTNLFSVSPHAAHSCLLPLRQAVIERMEKASSAGKRCVVGVCGIPGSGKSTFVQLLSHALNSDDHGSQTCAVLGMDGYHRSNGWLEEHGVGADKGLPHTFDCEQFVADLERIRDSPHEEFRLPAYDRVLHDPVEGGVTVKAGVPVVLVDGIYLLHQEGAWAEARGSLDVCVMLRCNEETAHARVTKRKVSNGASVEAAQAGQPVVSRITEIVKSSAHLADVKVTLKGGDGSDEALQAESVEVSEACCPPSLMAVGLNPAYQKTLQLPKFVPNDVNRASSVSVSCGGKGQHVAIAANTMAKGSAMVAHFLGAKGEQGTTIHQTLLGVGVAQIVEWTEGVTRTCTTLLDQESGQMTELIEPSESVPSSAVLNLTASIKHMLPSMRGVALCGTFPPGVDESLYASVAAALPYNTTLILDGFKGVQATLDTGRVDVLKINSDELASLTGEHNDHDTAAALCLTKFLSPRACLAITRGPDQASLYLRGDNDALSAVDFQIPPLEAVNPIGAGDTCTAGMLYGVAAGYSREEAFRWGLACASASCLSLRGADFSLSTAAALYEAITVSPPRPLPSPPT